MKVTAAVARAPEQPFDLVECELREPQAGEVLVRIEACGVCHTDLGAKYQHIPVPLPAVLGHEGAGVVVSVGEGVTDVKPGDHVLMSFGSCGTCHNCKDDHPSYCEHFLPINFFNARGADPILTENGKVLTGDFFTQSAFATHAIATVRNVVKIDKNLPLSLMAPLGCGIQTGMGAILNSLKPQAGSSFAVFGAGSVGLAALIAAKIAGCTPLIAVDVSDDRLALAKEVGATHTINGAGEDAVKRIQEITTSGADTTFDTTGIPQVVAQAFECLNMCGQLGTVAAPPMGTKYAFDAHALLAGRRVIGVIEGDSLPSEFIPKLIEYYKKDQLPLEKLITTFPFSQINEAIAATAEGKVLKAVLVMSNE